jgi:predicted permease
LRQLLTESLLLSTVGGALGLLLAHWLTNAALSILPFTLPRAEEVGLDSHVLIFTVGLSIASGILFGLTPALTAARPDIQQTLKQSARGASSFSRRTQNVFVVAEMAMALVLLIGAGLMVRSLMRLWKVDPGFNPNNVLSLGMSLPPSIMNQKPDALRANIRDLDARLAVIPGVQAETQTWGAVPMGGDDEQLFWMAGHPKPASENDMKWAIDYIVGPDYLKVMGIPLQRGRFITAQDNLHSQQIVVVDDVFARTYFPNQEAVGKQIVLNNGEKQVEIVGVVGHVKQWGLDRDDTEQLRAQVYIPCMQMPDSFLAGGSATNVLLRTDGRAPNSAVVDAIRGAASNMNGHPSVFGVQTMNSIISDTMAQRRFSMILLGTFAALALLLASIGIYGVISYLVARRTQEIGIRMAVGANTADVLRLVLVDGSKLALMGIAVGIAGALAATRLMSNMLYDVSTTDPITFVSISALLLGIAMVACYVPALRATRVDPVTALRNE